MESFQDSDPLKIAEFFDIRGLVVEGGSIKGKLEVLQTVGENGPCPVRKY